MSKFEEPKKTTQGMIIDDLVFKETNNISDLEKMKRVIFKI